MTSFLAESYFHRLDPFAIRFPDSWSQLPLVPDGIRWYGLSYAIGFVIAWLMYRWVARKQWSPIPKETVPDLMFAVILGVVLGGRIGYAVFYQPELLIGFTSQFPFWDLLAINVGGMASHGGMVGVILALCIFGYKRKISINHMLDIGALASSPGLFLGRFANYVNGELWGKALPPSMQMDPPWWSVKYPEEVFQRGYTSELAPLQLVVENGERFLWNIVEAARAGNETVIETLRPLLTAYYPSQVFQAFTDGPLLFGFLVLVWLKPRKPGVVGSWFLIWYGVLRIVSELFRQPDEGVALSFGLLSRGQTLSALMILSGCVALWITSRRNVQPIGGLFNNSG